MAADAICAANMGVVAGPACEVPAGECELAARLDAARAGAAPVTRQRGSTPNPDHAYELAGHLIWHDAFVYVEEKRRRAPLGNLAALPARRVVCARACAPGPF